MPLLATMVVALPAHAQFSCAVPAGVGESGGGVYWFDWTGFNLNSGSADRSFTLPDGRFVTVTVTLVSGSGVQGVSIGTVRPLGLLYNGTPSSTVPGVKALRQNTSFGADSVIDVSFSIPLDAVVADGEATAPSEQLVFTVDAGEHFEAFASRAPDEFTLTGNGTNVVTITGATNSAPFGTPVLVTRDQTSVRALLDSQNGGRTGAAFGVLLGDVGDASGPGVAAHRVANVHSGCTFFADVTPHLGAAATDRNYPASVENAAADGDDTSFAADEDGVTISTLGLGKTVSIPVTANGAGVLQAWVDWNDDTTFTASEQVITDQALTGGTTNVNVTAPASATLGDVYARFRYATASGLGPTGFAADGEVEDYLVTITNSVTAMNDSASGVNGAAGATNVVNVLDNDLVDGAAATIANSTLSLSGALPGSLSFNTANGAVSVNAGSAPGTYQFDYEVCHGVATSICEIATVSIGVAGAFTVPPDPTVNCTANWYLFDGPVDINAPDRFNPTRYGFSKIPTNLGADLWYGTFATPDRIESGLSLETPPPEVLATRVYYGVGYTVHPPGATVNLLVSDTNGLNESHMFAVFDSAGNMLARFPSPARVAGGEFLVASDNQTPPRDSETIRFFNSWSIAGDFPGEPFQFTAPADGQVFLHYIMVDEAGRKGALLPIDGLCGAVVLAADKSVSLADAGGYAIPGNDVLYTINIINNGAGAADADSIFIIDSLPPEISFFNGDFNGAGPGSDVIGFNQSGASLTFDDTVDAAYSNSTMRPVNFSQCTYTPSAGYDENVKHICFNPKGTFPSGDPAPSFTVIFRAGVK